MRETWANVLAAVMAVGLLTASFCPIARVCAQADTGAEYKEFIARAVQEFQLGNWREARALFKQAHQLNPNARTLRGMGMAAFEMREYLPALRDLKAALAETRKPLTESQRKQVEKLMAQAETFVGRFRVETAPPDAALEVDGRPAELGEDNALLLDLGDHTIVARAPGYLEFTRELVVEGGEDKELSLVLEPVPEQVAAAPVPVPAPDEAGAEATAEQGTDSDSQSEQTDKGDKGADSGGREQQQDEDDEASSGPLWAWVALGASGLCALSAGVFWGIGESRYSELEKQCETWCTEAEREEAQSDLDTTDGLTNVFLGLAGTFAVGSVVLFFLESADGSDSAASEKDVAFGIGPASAQLRGRF